MRSIIILPAIISILVGFASAGDLDLNIVYPKEGQFIGAVDSMFIFGSVQPGSELNINGNNIPVHKDGGWLAFLPVSPGEYTFSIKAQSDKLSESKELSILLSELPKYNYSDISINETSLFPNREFHAVAGTELALSANGLPHCNMICVIKPMNDTICMKELPPKHYYRNKNVFDASVSEQLQYPDSMLIRGRYTGKYLIPKAEYDSLIFEYTIFPPSPRQITTLRKNGNYLANLRQPVTAVASRSVTLYKLNKLPTVELKDSISIIRSGPGKGYLCVHQPQGIRAKLLGKNGRWLKIKLSDNQAGWILDTVATILPHTEPVPHSYISRVQTINYDDKVSVVFNTTGRHPFRVLENIEEKSITVFIYGADTDTDWIRYDNKDKLIKHAVWYQPEAGVYAFKMYLNDSKIWGYDAHYVGHEFHFDIKKFPRKIWDISQFRFIIDPGHEPDAGAVGPTGLTEKEANLAISLRLKTALEGEGAEVVMTRSDETGLGIYDRPKKAVKEKADIFISIHNNALPNGTNPFENNGTATFYYHPHSALLAYEVHNEMAKSLPLKDFGWYYGNFAVIRPTQYPAILVECAFMMIPEQEAKLRTKKFQKKIADAIVSGIKNYIGGPKLNDWDHLIK
ncbi:MAG: N-acetylmuramoyl-L-alanine amidase [candidate division Zixibacteria bacterium]|nr:N-acetylmuramoyl-L-alanine amidase [candidate division Zixibacteria bacterium]